MTSKKEISQVMRAMRAKRKDYSTAGFKNPEVQKKALEARERNAQTKDTTGGENQPKDKDFAQI